MNYAIDNRTVRAMTREAERIRAIRLDKPAIPDCSVVDGVIHASLQ